MTNQIQGEILFKGIDHTAGTPEWVYTPWMTVRGDKALFAVEVLQIAASTSIYWAVETRTKESTTTTAIVALQTVSAVGVSIASMIAGETAMELVRYRIATGSGADASKWAILRVLEPSWQADAAANLLPNPLAGLIT